MAPVNGGAQSLFASGQITPTFITLDSTYVYWYDDWDWNTMSGGTLMKAPRGGGGPISTLVTGEGTTAGLVVDASHIYWGRYYQGVMDAPIGGGAATQLAPAAGVGWLAIDGSNLYWKMSNSGGSIYRAPLAGGAPVLVVQNAGLTSYLEQPIVVDATSLYWVTTGGVMKLTPK
jgi:hypothetical protein